jgi:D-beta-D-heptose 7-phosphate kinase/D-beta-D-heptose 1-phosphate adenosyltransferase
MKKPKILVVGDSCMDVYVYGKCLRMCPDAPVPVMVPTETITYPGMAGNVVRNIEALGAEITTLTNKEQIHKTRYVDSKTNHMFIRVDTGEEQIARVKDLDKINFKAFDAIVISDYCKGFLEEEDIAYIAENSDWEHTTTFLDTKKVINNIFVDKINYIKINESEFAKCRGHISQKVLDKTIVTISSQGCIHDGKVYPVQKVDVKDNTGAGDTFLSGLAVKYCQTHDIIKAINYANKCATYVVQRKGTTIVNPNEL